MLRTALGEDLRQEPIPALSIDHRRRRRVQYVRVQVGAGDAGLHVLDQASELLWPEATVHVPLLPPDMLERSGRRFRHQSDYVRAAEGAEAGLVFRREVRIARVEGHAVSQAPQQAHEVSLDERINLDPGRQVASRVK